MNESVSCYYQDVLYIICLVLGDQDLNIRFNWTFTDLYPRDFVANDLSTEVVADGTKGAPRNCISSGKECASANLDVLEETMRVFFLALKTNRSTTSRCTCNTAPDTDNSCDNSCF